MALLQHGHNREIEPVTHVPSGSVRSTRKESAMKLRPQRSVLRKIAARRGKIEEPRSAWATVLIARPTEMARHQRVAGDHGGRVLTPREIEVLHLVANGETDQQIADSLYVSRRTV